jgi:hypothetical protein
VGVVADDGSVAPVGSVGAAGDAVPVGSVPDEGSEVGAEVGSVDVGVVGTVEPLESVEVAGGVLVVPLVVPPVAVGPAADVGVPGSGSGAGWDDDDVPPPLSAGPAGGVNPPEFPADDEPVPVDVGADVAVVIGVVEGAEEGIPIGVEVTVEDAGPATRPAEGAVRAGTEATRCSRAVGGAPDPCSD